jgi:hypothetical protein
MLYLGIEPFFFLKKKDVPELLEKGYELQYITYVRNNHTLVAYRGNDSKGSFIFTLGTRWM